MTRERLTALSWVLIVLYAIVNVIRSVTPNLMPEVAVAALMTFLPFVFFVAHGAINYRLRDLLVFATITLVVSNLFENLSILTGFPFGRYYYSDNLGPKLFLVPVLIGPAYLGTGYLSWVIAQLILGATNAWLVGRLVFAVPILASFMMVAWDLSFDPIVSTIRHDWVWRDGGNYFGVPFSNFMGWWLTTYLFLQLFALYLRRRQQVYATIAQPSRSHNLQAVTFYGLIAAGIVLNSLTQTTTATATDQVGVVWRAQDIYVVSGLITIFTMGAFTALGLMKVHETPVQPMESHG